MTPTEFRDIRKKIGLHQAELAYVLGYKGRMQVTKIERGDKGISNTLDRLMQAYASGYVPEALLEIWEARDGPDGIHTASELARMEGD
jgi:transcriptional regulator with XRE-family HTH domain